MGATMEDVKSGFSLSAEESSAPGGYGTCSTVPQCQKEATIQSQSDVEESNDPSEVIKFPGPGEVVHSPIYGNCVVATKDIEQGELIGVERPLLVGPAGAAFSDNDEFSACLSCNKVIKNSAAFKCSKCNWSICGPLCEENDLHRLNECHILARNSLLPTGARFDYNCIRVLRCLLLRETAPHKWNRILRFESHKIERKEYTNLKEGLKVLFDFVRIGCKLTEYDEDTIDHVFGVLMINLFGTHDSLGHTAVLLDKMSLFAHSCLPNAFHVITKSTASDSVEQEAIQPTDYYVSKTGLAMKVYAQLPIKKGELITIQYVDISLPVHARRKVLKENYFFDCNCSKCQSDLTEQTIRMDDAEGTINIPFSSYASTLPRDYTPTNGWKFPLCVILICFGSLLIVAFLIWCLSLL